MTADRPDPARRRFLTTAATVVGGAGAAAAAVPFIAAMTPSERARAIGAPVEEDIADLQPGELRRVQWQGKPVWILRRDPQDLATLEKIKGDLRDPASEEAQQPDYARNEYRSIRPEILIVVGLCTHLGCSPTYVPARDAEAHGLPGDWPGGFFCPGHGRRSDPAGPACRGAPAPATLLVPPHQYLRDTRALTGDDGGAA